MMSEPMFVISEDELSAIEIILKQAGIPIKRNVLLTEIRSRKLSTELETAYRHGFNDGQAEGMPEALRAERERVLNKIIDKLMDKPLSDCGIDSMNRMGEIVESLMGEP